MTQLSERNVLVTGAASGIGLLLAERFAARGARTILWDVDAVALEAALARVAAAGGGPAAAYVCDLSDRQSIESTAARVVARHGRVDVLVNNAGIVNGKRLLELSDAEIERTFAVNTLALFRTVRAFLPGMLAAGEGHVVTIASAAGIAAAPRLADYSASKAAAIAFDEALRLELARDAAPVRTTIVCPFFVATGMFAGARTRFPRLLPILAPSVVAARIVDAIEADRARLVLPAFVKSTWLLRLLPVAWFDAAMGFFGITRSMDDFTGRGRTPRS
ncbi:MAG TPA: SDR family oxidoreductase [Burkholderiaceae bacterium]|mgnify:CR=1 FL=1|nr:SDR family oxidoreductase [Burkholderiaceae bacterium]HRA77883.1 SDR family oxidoreductase [Burkholderiaceae bacterium]